MLIKDHGPVLPTVRVDVSERGRCLKRLSALTNHRKSPQMQEFEASLLPSSQHGQKCSTVISTRPTTHHKLLTLPESLHVLSIFLVA